MTSERLDAIRQAAIEKAARGAYAADDWGDWAAQKPETQSRYRELVTAGIDRSGLLDELSRALDRETALTDALRDRLRDCVPCRGTGLAEVIENGVRTGERVVCPRCESARIVLAGGDS